MDKMLIFIIGLALALPTFAGETKSSLQHCQAAAEAIEPFVKRPMHNGESYEQMAQRTTAHSLARRGHVFEKSKAPAIRDYLWVENEKERLRRKHLHSRMLNCANGTLPVESCTGEAVKVAMTDKPMREVAVRVLGQLGVADAFVVSTLLSLAKDEYYAVQALGSLDYSKAPLLKAMVVDQLRGPDDQSTAKNYVGLALLNDGEVLNHVLGELESQDHTQVWNAVRYIMTVKDPFASLDLANLVKRNPSLHVKAMALRALAYYKMLGLLTYFEPTTLFAQLVKTHNPIGRNAMSGSNWVYLVLLRPEQCVE